MFDLTFELRHVAVLDHAQAPVFDRDPETTRREGAAAGFRLSRRVDRANRG